MTRQRSRRTFLKSSLATAGGLTWIHANVLRAQQQAEARHGRLEVTKVETHAINVPYKRFLHDQLSHFYGPTKRYVYVVHANNGMLGLGESGGREPQATIDHYLGTNPFDHVGDETSLGLGTAMYDLMGQAAGVPVYKLFGQRYRKWVPVACWTVSNDPKRMARTVKEYAAQGYTWMKYHLSPFENVIDQLRAMQKVAPRGFKVHLDLTMGGTVDHTPALVEKICRFPIVGAFEDPLLEKDLDSYVELRQRSRVPIVLHHSPLGATFEVLRRAADAYIVGHAKIGVAIRRAGLFAAANLPFMLQNVGGTITRTMTTHMHAAFKTATFHFNSDAESWSDDVVKQRLEPINGLLRVPEKPGLGLTLDREALERLKKLNLPEQKKWILKTEYDNGVQMFNLVDPKDSIFLVRPDRRRELPHSYDAPLRSTWWDDDGSKEYKELAKRLESDGVLLKRKQP